MNGLVMIVAEETLDSSKKRKLQAEESDLLPLPKHFCLNKQTSLPDSSCISSDIESAGCSYAMVEDTKTSDETSSSSTSVTGASLYVVKDSTYSTGSSISSIDQCCSKGNDKTLEYLEDFSHMEFICSEFADEDLQEVLNPVESYVLSSARWSVTNQDSEEASVKPTIDQEFEDYFSALMM